MESPDSDSSHGTGGRKPADFDSCKNRQLAMREQCKPTGALALRRKLFRLTAATFALIGATTLAVNVRQIASGIDYAVEHTTLTYVIVDAGPHFDGWPHDPPNKLHYHFRDVFYQDRMSHSLPFMAPWAVILDPSRLLTRPENKVAREALSNNPTGGDGYKVHLGPALRGLNWYAINRQLEPFTDATVAIGLLLFIYALSTRRKYLQHDELGLYLHDQRDRTKGKPTVLPWKCLKTVEVLPLKQNLFGVEEKFPSIRFTADHGLPTTIKWNEIITCTEPGSFINALKTWAPNAVANCQFPTEVPLDKVDSGTYTQLWFKYYSKSSDRKRACQLEMDEVLKEGRYTISRRIGGGGQGTAYVARDSYESGANVVLKEYILPVHRGEQVMEESARKLRREAEVLAKIDHPNIVKLLDEFVEDHRGYIVMEYVVGEQLKTFVTEHGVQSEETVIEIAKQICSMLEYLHGMDPPIIHRDVTPDNLIRQEDGIVKLVDFNVAHQLESAATATVVGKHAYIPPEQFRGKPTQQSDIYGLGCTLHYLLTGADPEPLTVSHPKSLNAGVSEQLDEIVAKCTVMDAKKRFQTAQEVLDALEGLQPARGEESPVDEGVKLSLKLKSAVP
jgi:tRNA A-37 threonylcarbamoyl transferase component Bud32